MKISVVKGVTVIELLVVLSTITLLLAVGVPRVEDIAIRSRVNEGLIMAAAARQAVQLSCISNPSAQIYDLEKTAFEFEPTQYVAEVLVAANCKEQLLWVGVITRNTGANLDPYLSYHSSPGPSFRDVDWQCQLILGQENHVPAYCPAPVH